MVYVNTVDFLIITQHWQLKIQKNPIWPLMASSLVQCQMDSH